MKPLYNYALMLGAAGALLTSCSNEDLVGDKTVETGKTIHMVVSAMRESDTDIESRTGLDEANGALSCTWTENDKILVTDKSGKKLGILTLDKNYDGKKEGEFNGDLNGVEDGNQTLNYYYLGTEVSNNNYESVNSRAPYVADFSTQKGTLESLSEYDMLTVAKGTVIDGDYTYFEKINFQRRVSFARFKMNLPAGVTYPVTVSMQGDELRNTANLQLTDLSAEYLKGEVTVENVGGKEFYITYLPTEGKDKLNFRAVDAAGKVYSGTYDVSKAVAQNKYFRKALGDGEFEGLPINFEEVIEYNIILKDATENGNVIENPGLDLSDPTNVVLPGDPNPNTDPEIEFKGWKIEGSDDEPTTDPWNLTEEGKGPVVTLVPVYAEKQYDYTLIFEYISTADNQTYVELDRKTIKGANNLTVTLSKYDSDAKANLPESQPLISWINKAQTSPVNDMAQVTFSKDNKTITVLAMCEWFVKFKDELDPTVVYTPNGAHRVHNFLYTWNFKNKFPAEPTKEGYKFLGWYYNDQKVTTASQVVLTKDNLNPIIYSKWEKIPNPNTVTTPGYDHGTFN